MILNNLMVVSDKVLSMGIIKLNCVLKLNWIAWNRTFFDIQTAYLFLTKLFEIELFFDIETVLS